MDYDPALPYKCDHSTDQQILSIYYYFWLADQFRIFTRRACSGHFLAKVYQAPFCALFFGRRFCLAGARKKVAKDPAELNKAHRCKRQGSRQTSKFSPLPAAKDRDVLAFRKHKQPVADCTEQPLDDLVPSYSYTCESLNIYPSTNTIHDRSSLFRSSFERDSTIFIHYIFQGFVKFSRSRTICVSAYIKSAAILCVIVTLSLYTHTSASRRVIVAFALHNNFFRVLELRSTLSSQLQRPHRDINFILPSTNS